MPNYDQYNAQGRVELDGGGISRPYVPQYPVRTMRENVPNAQVPGLAQPNDLRVLLSASPKQISPPRGYYAAAHGPQPQTVSYGRYYYNASAPTMAQGAFGPLAGGVSDKFDEGPGRNTSIPDATAAILSVATTINGGVGRRRGGR